MCSCLDEEVLVCVRVGCDRLHCRRWKPVFDVPCACSICRAAVLCPCTEGGAQWPLGIWQICLVRKFVLSVGRRAPVVVQGVPARIPSVQYTVMLMPPPPERNPRTDRAFFNNKEAASRPAWPAQ